MSGPPTSTDEKPRAGRRGAPRVPRGAPSVGGCGGPCRGPPRRSVTDLLDALEVETGHDPEACVIWLHGRGADGHDFEPVVPALDLPEEPGLRFGFPPA